MGKWKLAKVQNCHRPLLYYTLDTRLEQPSHLHNPQISLSNSHTSYVSSIFYPSFIKRPFPPCSFMCPTTLDLPIHLPSPVSQISTRPTPPNRYKDQSQSSTRFKADVTGPTRLPSSHPPPTKYNKPLPQRYKTPQCAPPIAHRSSLSHHHTTLPSPTTRQTS